MGLFHPSHLYGDSAWWLVDVVRSSDRLERKKERKKEELIEREGSLVLWLHDVGDIFLPIGKCFSYAETHFKSEGKKKKAILMNVLGNYKREKERNSFERSGLYINCFKAPSF